MGLNRQDKAAVIEEVAGIVANSSSIVIAEYRGLSVEAVTKLRAEARKNNVTLRVVKNTLVRRAVEGTEFAGLADQFVGPLVYGFSADPVAAAKVLVNFAKDNDKLVIKGGAMANTVMDVEAVKQLATMLKPASSKGQYLRKVAVSSTMGIGVRVDIGSINN